MKIAYGDLGLKPNEFWRSTILEIKVMIEAKKTYQKNQFMKDRWLIWHTEALRRQKRLTPLKMFLKDKLSKARRVYGEEAKRLQQQHEDISAAFLKAKSKKKEGEDDC